MATTASKVPAQAQPKTAQPPARWNDRDFFGGLRDEVEHVFEEFDRGMWGLPARWRGLTMEPFRKQGQALAMMPSVDAIEKDDVFEVTADLPGVDEKNVEVKMSGDVLTIRGQREERKEEKKKDYYICERQFGAFERSFQIPENVESDKIDACFKNGVLTVTLPKKPGSMKAEKKINIHA
jgi:HSP20 family protein